MKSDIHDPTFASSFERAIAYMNKTQCGSITAFRKFDSNGNALSINEKRRRNKRLEADIRASGLTYIKDSAGSVENRGKDNETRTAADMFCIINNRFAPKDFIKLMVSWCAKYEQDLVLITDPQQERDPRNGQPLIDRPINIIGTYYDKNGNIDSTFDHAAIQDVEAYFTHICGNDLVLSSAGYVKTEGHQIYDTSGRILAIQDFKDLYPDLV